MHADKASFRSLAVHAAAFALLCFSVYVGFFHGVDYASAQTALEQFGDTTRLSDEPLLATVARIIRAFIGLLGIIFTILMIYAGWLYMVSRGDAQKTGKAKKLIGQAVIGLLIIMFSYSFASWIIGKLLDDDQQAAVQIVAKQYAEPLKGALGGGIINSHYPPHLAQDIPRNTKIFLDVKEPINPASFIAGWQQGQDKSGPLNVNNVLIYRTADGKDQALAADQVVVDVDITSKFVVFRPDALLGDGISDMNYTVELLPAIETADGSAAFTGVNKKGYNWTFEIGTEVDLTPPRIVSVMPVANAEHPRNMSIEVTFNEAMDPIAASGEYVINGPNPLFTNVEVTSDPIPPANGGGDAHVQGLFEVSNVYRTITFTTTDACAKDACGDTVYCLPATSNITARLKAADVDPENVPQAKLVGGKPNGLTDATGNSLDGNGDGKGCQGVNNVELCPGNQDGHTWAFSTSAAIDDSVPKIESMSPDFREGEISLADPIEITFEKLLKSSSINSSSVSLWPQNIADAEDSWWFYSTKDDLVQGKTKISIQHPTFISLEQGAENYYPVLNEKLKGANQFCMYPISVTGKQCNTNDNNPYCCGIAVAAGEIKAEECNTLTGDQLPFN